MKLNQIVGASKPRRFLSTLAAGFICGVSAAEAVNIAPLGTGRLGVNTALNTTYGTNVAQSGTASLINDSFSSMTSLPPARRWRNARAF